LRIAVAGKLTACASPGGGEIQMRKTIEALAQRGRNVAFWSPWEQGFSGIDLLHLFGSAPEFLPVVAAARAKRIPVVLSPIAWFNRADCWREPGSLIAKIARMVNFELRAVCPQWPSWRRKLYQQVQCLLPNSFVEAQQLQDLFRVPAARIKVVPNAADSKFGLQKFGIESGINSSRGYILYPGRIEPRKNQLELLRALSGTREPLILLGDPVPGHEDYYAKCREIAGPEVQFLPRVEHEDPVLERLYAGCGCVVLCSWYETPGLAALEAGMSGIPLVLTDQGATREYFGPFAQYVSPGDRSGLRDAVRKALQRPRDPNLSAWVRERYSWEAAARATETAYAEAVNYA